MPHINLPYMIGLVGFSSFHAIAALVGIWAMRTTLLVSPIALVNFALILLTPVFGGHFLADIVAGALMVAAAIFAYHSKVALQWLKSPRFVDIHTRGISLPKQSHN